MFDFGDNVILDSLRIPWLIWIQILVMFLLTLTILLSYFNIFDVDSSSSNDSPSFKHVSSSFASNQEAGNRGARREITNTTSNRVRRVDNNSRRDGPLAKDSDPFPVAERFFHPCRYFFLVKEAFLKCLGLGSGSQNSADEEHEHED